MISGACRLSAKHRIATANETANETVRFFARFRSRYARKTQDVHRIRHYFSW
jgi:hypothetical protein